MLGGLDTGAQKAHAWKEAAAEALYSTTVMK